MCGRKGSTLQPVGSGRPERARTESNSFSPAWWITSIPSLSKSGAASVMARFNTREP